MWPFIPFEWQSFKDVLIRFPMPLHNRRPENFASAGSGSLTLLKKQPVFPEAVFFDGEAVNKISHLKDPFQTVHAALL